MKLKKISKSLILASALALTYSAHADEIIHFGTFTGFKVCDLHNICVSSTEPHDVSVQLSPNYGKWENSFQKDGLIVDATVAVSHVSSGYYFDFFVTVSLEEDPNSAKTTQGSLFAKSLEQMDGFSIETAPMTIDSKSISFSLGLSQSNKARL